MKEIMIFGGTTEGRRLAEYCRDKGIRASVSVVSHYGKSLLPQCPWIEIQEKALSQEEMKLWMEEKQPLLVIDATHPYADCVTGYIKKNCEDFNIPYIRVIRKEGKAETDQMVLVSSPEEAAEYLSAVKGNILLTTGSKELAAFTKIPDYEERLFVRVLPSVQVLETCSRLSLKGSHVIAMQGPFSREMNRAMMEQLHIRYLVTKEAGKAGGFEEKIQGAREAGAFALVIGRPGKEEGISLEEAIQWLEKWRKNHREILAERDLWQDSKKMVKGSSSEEGKRRKLYLIGIGMGGNGQLTEQAVGVLKQCQAVFGAERMLEAVRKISDAPWKIREYQGNKIFSWLKEHREISVSAALFSGDTGFYSGAPSLFQYFREEEKRGEEAFEVEVIPGISTVSYMAAKLGKPWQNMAFASEHGRVCNVEAVLENLEKDKNRDGLFLLTEGEGQVVRLCERIRQVEKKLDAAYWIYAGERLSYPEERILGGRPEDLEKEGFSGLTALWIERKDRG